MATLKPEHKMFIVQRLACFDTPTLCAEAVKAEFGIDVVLPQILCYHPDRRQGARMSKELKNLFHETRRKYRDRTEDIPIANKTFRVEQLNDMAAAAKKKGNMVLAAALLEQAAKEMGEAYTNRQKIDHVSTDGSMTPSAPVDLSIYSTEDLQLLASIAEKHTSSDKKS